MTLACKYVSKGLEIGSPGNLASTLRGQSTVYIGLPDLADKALLSNGPPLYTEQIKKSQVREGLGAVFVVVVHNVFPRAVSWEPSIDEMQRFVYLLNLFLLLLNKPRCLFFLKTHLLSGAIRMGHSGLKNETCWLRVNCHGK